MQNVPTSAIYSLSRRHRTALLASCAIFSFAFTSGSLQAAEGDKVKIACVGDSITAGARLPEPNRYPKVLEGLLNQKGGKAVEVQNFGHGGQALLKKSDHPYGRTPPAAKDFNPNVVLIMLGTNDSKTKNWAFKDEFVGDLKEFVQEYISLPSKPVVFLVLPPPAYKVEYDIHGDVIKNEVVPKITEVAKARSLPTIDVFSAMSNHPELFDDGIHPNIAGAELLAKTIAAALIEKHVIK